MGREIVNEMPYPLNEVVYVWKPPAGRIVVRHPGPVDKNRFALDILRRHPAPEPAVAAVVTIVAHDKILSQRNLVRSEIVPERQVARNDPLVDML